MKRSTVFDKAYHDKNIIRSLKVTNSWNGPNKNAEARIV